MNQGDYVYAWNHKQPEKKVYTRFLHKLDGIQPSNICVSPQTLDTYPKKIHLARFDMVVPAIGAMIIESIDIENTIITVDKVHTDIYHGDILQGGHRVSAVLSPKKLLVILNHPITQKPGDPIQKINKHPLIPIQ